MARRCGAIPYHQRYAICDRGRHWRRVDHRLGGVGSGGRRADWSVEPRKNGRQRLVVRLAAGLSPQQPVQLAIAARRLFAPSGERLGVATCRRSIFAGRPEQATGRRAADRRLCDETPRRRTAEAAEARRACAVRSALLAAKSRDLLFERSDGRLRWRSPWCARSKVFRLDLVDVSGRPRAPRENIAALRFPSRIGWIGCSAALHGAMRRYDGRSLVVQASRLLK